MGAAPLLVLIGLAIGLGGCGRSSDDAEAKKAAAFDRALGPVQGSSFGDCQRRESDKLDRCLDYSDDLLGCYDIYQVRYQQCREAFGR